VGSELCIRDSQIRRFDADEIVAFARVFEKPIAYFFCVPESHYRGKPVVVNGKPGQPRAVVKSGPLSAREMTALSAQAWLPGIEVDPQKVFPHFFQLAYGLIAQAIDEYLEEDSRAIEELKSRSAKALAEVHARIARRALTPPQEAKLERDLLAAITPESKR